MANQSEAAARKDSTQNQGRSVLYGLPCADCHAYYASNVTECPVCHSIQRVTPSNVPRAIPMTTL
jgi:hypothetical protein